MTFISTYAKITNSRVFQDFKEKNPNAELCAGFFILDFLSNDNRESLDYKTDHKIFTFSVKGDGITIQEDRLLPVSENQQELTRIDPEIKIDTHELKSIAGTHALDEGVFAKFHKIIAVLQNHWDKDKSQRQIWNLTCMLDSLIILNILIDSETGEVIKFERKSMTDLIRKK